MVHGKMRQMRTYAHAMCAQRRLVVVAPFARGRHRSFVMPSLGLALLPWPPNLLVLVQAFLGAWPLPCFFPLFFSSFFSPSLSLLLLLLSMLLLLVAGTEEDAKSIKFSLAEVACVHNQSREWDQQLVVYTICDVHTLALAGGKGVPNMSSIYW